MPTIRANAEEESGFLHGHATSVGTEQIPPWSFAPRRKDNDEGLFLAG
jgi:hypothetical protein